MGGAIFGTAKAVIHWHWAYEDAAGDDSLPSMTLAPGSLVTMAQVRDDTLTLHQPPPKPVEQIQIGDKVKWPGHELNYVVTGKKTNADGSITLTLGLDPEDDPNDDAYDLTQQGYRLHEAYLDVQHTGATHVKQGLEVYKAVAEFYATGPFYELGGAALVAASGKASELLRLAAAQKGLAQKAGEVAAKVRAYAAKVRQAVTNAKQEGKSAQEIAQLTKKAENAEKEAGQLQAASQELHGLATESKPVGGTMHELATDYQATKAGQGGELQQLALPQGGTPSVTVGGLDENEVAFANEISKLLGTHVKGAPKMEKGIDGWIGSKAITLKQTNVPASEPYGRRLKGLLREATRAVKLAGLHGYYQGGVQCFVKAPNITTQELLEFAGPNTPLRNIASSGTLESITVFCSNGVVIIR